MPTFQRFPQPFNFPSHWTGRGFKSKYLLMASYPHKTKKAGHQRPSAPPASRYSLVFKAFSYAKLKSPQPIVSSTEDFRGAADGSRTRTPIRTQAPQACQSTNSSTAAKRSHCTDRLIIILFLKGFVNGIFQVFKHNRNQQKSSLTDSSFCARIIKLSALFASITQQYRATAS